MSTKTGETALRWREDVRHPILKEMIAILDIEALTQAYTVWWQTYTRCVRNAPSNRMGISTVDAAQAGETANRAVRELLAANTGVKPL